MSTWHISQGTIFTGQEAVSLPALSLKQTQTNVTEGNSIPKINWFV